MFSTGNVIIRFFNAGKILKKSFTATVELKQGQLLKNIESSLSFRYCSSKNKFNESTDDTLEIDYKAITNGDHELEHKLKVIILETEVMRQEGRAVPENQYITNSNWNELLSLPSRSGRRKYLEYLFKLSKRKENEEVKKQERRIKLEEHRQEREQNKSVKESLEDFVVKYDLQHNNILLRVYDSTINNMYNNRLIQAIQFGQKLVIDCGYDVNMTNRENLNCAKQLMFLFAENRVHDDPFDLHMCNANRDGTLMQQFKKNVPTMDEPWFPLNVHKCSYLDLFPKHQLVYLTPHCQEEIKEYDHDAVYIIGAIVDKVNNEPLSLAKAKREGLKMQKFPLDRYLSWGAGSGKSLTLNQVTNILLDLKLTGDWEQALRHVPRRKLMDHVVADNVRKTVSMNNFDNAGKRKWSPASNVNFDDLGYNRNNRQREDRGKNRRIVSVTKILTGS